VEIFKAQGAPTPVANGKNLQSENLKYFVWTPLGSVVLTYG
jgi:hypothetical protein